MQTSPSVFIREKIKAIETAMEARRQSAETWSGGTNESWLLAGCKLSKVQRHLIADRERRIISKLKQEIENYQMVLKSLQ